MAHDEDPCENVVHSSDRGDATWVCDGAHMGGGGGGEALLLDRDANGDRKPPERRKFGHRTSE